MIMSLLLLRPRTPDASVLLGFHKSSAARVKTELRTPRLELYGQQYQDSENNLAPSSSSRRKRVEEAALWCIQYVARYHVSIP